MLEKCLFQFQKDNGENGSCGLGVQEWIGGFIINE